MLAVRCVFAFVVGSSLLLGATGCDEGQGDNPALSMRPMAIDSIAHDPIVSERTTPDSDGFDTVLSWGSGERQVGLLPYLEDRPAQGPLALSATNDGGVVILDQVNRRLVRLDANGDWLAPLEAPPGGTDVAADSSGRIAVLSLINHRVTLISTDGTVEHVPVPTALRQAGYIHFDDGDHLRLETGRQETFDLGRPGAWVAWPNLLKTKAPGLGSAGGGRLVQALVQDGRASLVFPEEKGGKRVVAYDEGIASMAVFASRDDGTLVVTERFVGDDATRTLELVGADGRVETIAELPGAPLYFPYRDLAITRRGDIVSLQPARDGLHIVTFARQGGAK